VAKAKKESPYQVPKSPMWVAPMLDSPSKEKDTLIKNMKEQLIQVCMVGECKYGSVEWNT